MAGKSQKSLIPIFQKAKEQLSGPVRQNIQPSHTLNSPALTLHCLCKTAMHVFTLTRTMEKYFCPGSCNSFL
jgi:hypothetical protein